MAYFVATHSSEPRQLKIRDSTARAALFNLEYEATFTRKWEKGSYKIDRIEDPYSDWKSQHFLKAASEHLPIPPIPNELLQGRRYWFPIVKEDGVIELVPDWKYGEDNLSVSMSPGKFLQKYYPSLSAKEVEEWISLCRNSSVTLEILSEPSAIAEAYINGPRSCMSHSAASYDLPIHPSEAYGAPGDLQLAILKHRGLVKGRALVWPERKYHGRVYGMVTELTQMLNDEGYTRHHFNGARIRKIKYKDYNHVFVLPWIDDSNLSQHLLKHHGDNFFVLHDKGGMNATSTRGVINLERWNECIYCHGLFPIRAGEVCRSCQELYSPCVVCNEVDTEEHPTRRDLNVLNEDYLHSPTTHEECYLSLDMCSHSGYRCMPGCSLIVEYIDGKNTYHVGRISKYHLSRSFGLRRHMSITNGILRISKKEREGKFARYLASNEHQLAINV
jgi:hypothetical protein